MTRDSQVAATASIDPTSLVAPGARIGPGCHIGAFCRIGPQAVLGEGVVLHSHVVIDGDTRIGAGTEVHPFTLLGGPPQHRGYLGEPTRLEIGESCEIREQVSIHRGTVLDKGLTRIGNRVMLMAQVHIAHDCVLADDVTVAGNTALAGHVEVGAHAFIGGVSGIHQRVRIGERAMIGGVAGIPLDVIPYGLATGSPARLYGLNLIGLKRAGLPRQSIHALRAAYRELFDDGEVALAGRIDGVAERFGDVPEVMKVIGFIRAGSARQILSPGRRNAAGG